MRMLNRPLLTAAIAASLLSTAAAQEPIAAELKGAAREVGQLVQFFVDDPVLLPEGRNRAEVAASEAAHADFDRNAAFARALAEAKASQRPLLWYVPRILAAEEGFRPGRQMYRPAILDGYARNVFFADPEIAALIAQRFVAVRLAVSPELGERFAIKAPETVEPAFFIVSPQGQMTHRLDRLRSFNAGWLWRALAFAANGTEAAEGPMDWDDSQWLEAGYDPSRRIASRDEASEAPKHLQALLVQVRAHRLHGRPQQAISLHPQALQYAKDHAVVISQEISDRFHNALQLELGRCQLALRDIDNAMQTLRQVEAGPERAAARYLMGLGSYFRGSDSFARRYLKEAYAADPEGALGAKAAANLADGKDLTPIGPALHGFEDPFFRDVQLTARTSGRARSETDPEGTLQEAMEFLLAMQRDHGGFTDSRYAYWPSPDLTPNVWSAATAVALTALLEWRHLDPERVDQALARGEAYLFDENNMARGFQEEVYAETYKLTYLARKIDAAQSAAASEAARQRMVPIIGRLKTLQGYNGRAEGFFGHEYPNPFTTAAVMNGLQLAKEAGAQVPTVLMLRGAEGLLTVRDEHGAFGYAAKRMPKGPLEERLKNSMGRSAICESAILWSGHEAGSQKRVAEAMDIFWRYKDRLAAIRLCDFHTDGELGGFFFWHAVFHTTEAIKSLPKEDQAAHKQAMRKFILELAEQDGSFLDSHEMGKSYGTAMALIALKNCVEGDL